MIYYNQEELNFPYKYAGTIATPDGINRPLWRRQFVRRGDQYKDIVSPSFKLVNPGWWDAHQYSNDFYINFFRPNDISFSTLMPYHIVRDSEENFSYGESTRIISNTSTELKTFFCNPYSSTPGYSVPGANHYNPFPTQPGGTINLYTLDGLLFFKYALGGKYINAVCMDILLYLDNDGGGAIIGPDELHDMIGLRLIHTGADSYDWNEIMDGFTSNRKNWADISDIKILYASDDHKYYVIRYYAEYNFVQYDLVVDYGAYFYRPMTFMLTFYKTYLPERFHFICASYSNTFLPYSE